MAVEQEQVGYKFRLFRNTAENRDRVVIAAHGWAVDAGFQTHANLYFYCDHGEVLYCHVADIMHERYGAAERIFVGGYSRNYDLTKFQGYHGGAEGQVYQTYEDIIGLVESTDYDLLTVRHFGRVKRRFRGPPGGRLSEAVSELSRRGYVYVLCVHCRS